ncbi:unnamed protein product [Closterium sp. Naga37s-1]|nr:unnamed protein product [Closterium sp. Naga37s-1]
MAVFSQITVLPEEIGRLEGLETLSLCDLPNLKSRPRSLCQLQRLKYLQVNTCGALQSLFGDDDPRDAHMGAVGHELAGRIACFELAGHTGSSSAAGSCWGSEESDTALETLDLMDCSLLAQLPSGLRQMGKLQKLDEQKEEDGGRECGENEGEEGEEGEWEDGEESEGEGSKGDGSEREGTAERGRWSEMEMRRTRSEEVNLMNKDDSEEERAANFTGSTGDASGGADLATLFATL